MPANDLLLRLVEVFEGEKIRHPKIRSTVLAQWLLESGRATSELAKLHYNFAGLKWRSEMINYATPVEYTAHDGPDKYCKFATLESFVNGYFAFLNRSPYSGWEETADSGEAFIRFIGPIYAPANPDYAERVIALVNEAESLLQQAATNQSKPPKKAPKGLGTVVIDPGHGGAKNLPGSSANNAVSISGVKEKKLALDFCLILRDQLKSRAAANNEVINVVLTRTTDVNLSGKDRAAMAYDNRAKLFFSFHFNGSSNPNARGSETFYRDASNGNLNLDDDIAFATALHAGLMAGMSAIDPDAKDRGVKPDTLTGPKALGTLNDSRLGNNNYSTKSKMCHSAYIEAEFITNQSVETRLISGPQAIVSRTTVMEHVADAILGYLRIL